MLNWIRAHRALVGYVILCLGVVAALTMAFIAIDNANDKNNSTRCAVAGIVIQLTENSRRANTATIQAKASSPDQKKAAATNLAAIERSRNTTLDLLDHPTGEDCRIIDE